jgi:cytochrome c oxidase subunit 3
LASTLTKPHSGGGGFPESPFDGGGDGENKPERERTPPPEGYRIAIRLVLVGVSAMFLTLTVAYVLLNARAAPLPLPGVLWFSTATILACSLCIEAARRALKRRDESRFNRWLRVTMAGGLIFLAAQFAALWQLSAAGFFATANKRVWLAFLFMSLHGAHLFGGLLALVYLIVKSKYGDWTALRRRITLDSTALYWHFIDGLWVFLLALLFLWK